MAVTIDRESRRALTGSIDQEFFPSRALRRHHLCASRDENNAGKWQSLQPDFIVISRRSDGSLADSIIDPHGDYLADARGKLRALAAFAEAHGDRFVRTETIAKADDGSLRVLDLTDPAVSAAVLAFSGAKVSAL